MKKVKTEPGRDRDVRSHTTCLFQLSRHTHTDCTYVKCNVLQVRIFFSYIEWLIITLYRIHLFIGIECNIFLYLKNDPNVRKVWALTSYNQIQFFFGLYACARSRINLNTKSGFPLLIYFLKKDFYLRWALHIYIKKKISFLSQ